MTSLLRRLCVIAPIFAGALVFASATMPAAGQDLALDNVRSVLAPTGLLRVGVYPGSPTSEIRDTSGALHGVAVELGRELARRLGLPVMLVEYPRVAEVIDAMAKGALDLTVTNASPARAERVSFTEPLLALELGFLVPGGSTVANPSDLNAAGKRVGVTQGSTSERTLTRVLPNATLVPIPTIERVATLLRSHEVDAYATNKSVLFEMADGLPGSHVLAGCWGLEHLAIAYPKGRDAGTPFLSAFVVDVRATGLLAGAAARAGLRGQASSSCSP